MIPFDFSYFKPKTLKDAISIYERLNLEGKNPIYYGGGTEFISMARMSNVNSDGIIDIKDIDELNMLEIKEDKLIIGSANTLKKISESNHFPLLSQTVKRIADHTIQGKITLGGNLAGTIIYKESMLPLLITDSEISITGFDGEKKYPIMEVLNQGKKLSKGDLIIKVMINKSILNQPYIHVKRTKYEKIDYPLITMAALKYSGKMKVAFSGLCEYPYRSIQVEEFLNDQSISKKKRIDRIIEELSDDIVTDISGTKEYRKFVLSTMLEELLEKLEKVN